jgi:hypothetical protein
MSPNQAAYGRVRCGLFGLAIVLSSCTTRALWNATDPNKFVPVPQDQTTEMELERRGLAYRRNVKERLYFVEKTTSRKAEDYAARVLMTPLTIAVDGLLIASVLIPLLYAPTCRSRARDSDNSTSEIEIREGK